ncbi:MAG: YhgE/Pip domain-containing protein [Clostridia bacterium]|nr:YhgE/Pip domain-containing protein [Clostridia bacterium]
MNNNETSFKKIMKIVILAVVVLIPIIYSFFYLKSYWDPYKDLTGLKIAIVNLDKGENDENQGKEFVKSLKENGTFTICEETEEKANEGMKKGNYYATITIPSDFTKCLNSAGEKEKQKATIIYNPNQATNYLATQIINSAMKTVETNLQGKVNNKIAEKLSNKLNEVPEKLQDIVDGADQILEGSQDLNSGLNQIDDGTNKLNNSYTEFDNGVNSAYTGSKELDKGNEQITTGAKELLAGATNLDNGVAQINEALNVADLSKIQDLTSGINKLNVGVNGEEGLRNGINTYVYGTEGVANGVITLDATLENMIAQYTTAYTNAVATENTVDQLKYGTAIETLKAVKTKINDTSSGASLVQGAKMLGVADSTGLTAGEKLKYGTAQISEGVSQLNNATSDIQGLGTSITALKENLAKVKVGTGSLNEGIAKLKSGTEKTKAGSEALSSGLSKLDSSSKDVKTALNKLSEGTKSAYDGSTQLVNGIGTFKKEISKGIETTNKELEKLDGIKEFAEDPVEFKTESYGEVKSYGIAFTPLFLSIGLWVGGLMAYIVLYYDQKNRFWIFGSKNPNKLLQNIMYLGIGAVEGIVTAVLLKIGLGFEIQNMALYIFASTIIGMAFVSIIQCLIRNFDDVGKFIALIILVLQLAASGGTFPVETIDKGFQGFTNILPMTYSIKLLKEILVPTATNFKGQYIAILIGIIIVCLGITTVVDLLKNNKNDKAKASK